MAFPMDGTDYAYQEGDNVIDDLTGNAINVVDYIGDPPTTSHGLFILDNIAGAVASPEAGQGVFQYPSLSSVNKQSCVHPQNDLSLDVVDHFVDPPASVNGFGIAIQTRCETPTEYIAVKDWVDDLYATGHRNPYQPITSTASTGYLRCDYPGCETTCPTPGELNHHKRCHIPLEHRPHQCSLCSRRFLYPREVKRHMATHGIGPRHYCPVPRCSIASRGFARRDHLLRHLRKAHNELSASEPPFSESAPSIGTPSINVERVDGNIMTSSSNESSLAQQDASVVAARIDVRLRAIQQWTDTTGDDSVLQWLSKNFRSLRENLRVRPEQSGRNEPSERYPNAAITRGEYGNSSRSLERNSSANNDGESSRRTDDSGQARLNLQIAYETHTKRAKLRCPLFFREEGHRCHTVHKVIRDLIRHLKSHNLFFCSRCSRHYDTFNDLYTHACERICIHLGCNNRQPNTPHHMHQNGCPFSFGSLDTPQKWYALYALLLPRSKLPLWECVYVPDDSLCTEPATNASCPVPSQPADIAAPPTESESQYDDGIPSTFYPSRGFAIETNDYFPMDRSVAENMAYTVLEQITTIISGSRLQNEQIMRHNETIFQQNQQINRQNITITSLEGEVRDLREEMAQLRALVLSLAQSTLPQSRAEAQGASMDIDSFLGEESHTESNDGTWAASEFNEVETNGAEHNADAPSDVWANARASKPRAHGRKSSVRDSGYGTN